MGKSEPYIILDWLRILMKALTHQTETEQTHSTRKKKKKLLEYQWLRQEI